MKEYEKMYRDLKSVLTISTNEIFRQFMNSGKDPDFLMEEEVSDFIVDKINSNIDDIDNEQKQLQALTAIFMNIVINKIDKATAEPVEKEIE